MDLIAMIDRVNDIIAVSLQGTTAYKLLMELKDKLLEEADGEVMEEDDGY